MKYSPVGKSSRISAGLATLLLGFLFSAPAQAQSAGDNVYFDPTNSSTTTAGGAGDFSTSDFYDPNTTSDAPLVSGVNNIPGPFTSGEGAIFDGAASTVTVDSAVNPDYLEVNVGSGTETFGTAGNESTITLPVGWNLNSGPSFQNPINIDAGSENVVFNSNVDFDIFNHFYGGSAFNSASSGNVSFNGGITFTNDSTNPDNVGQPGIIFGSTTAATFTINSAVNYVEDAGSVSLTNPGNAPYIQLNSTGSTLTLTDNASFADTYVSVLAGTILDQGASFSSPVNGSGYPIRYGAIGYPISVGGAGQYLTDFAGMNVSTPIVFTNGGGTLGGALAAVTTFSAYEIVGWGNANMALTSAAGGRVNFTGDVHNGNGYLIITGGAGVINLDDIGSRAEDQTGGWEISNGTTLLNGNVPYFNGNGGNNTTITGSGLEIDNVATGSLVANVQTYATLGGSGSTLVPVTADGPNSVIAPGDAGQANLGILASTGTLSLLGGLTVANGATFNIKISADGTTNDVVNLGSTTLALSGAVTYNFTALGSVELNTPYDLIIGTGSDWTDSSSQVFNAPAGYTVTNYDFSAVNGGNSVSVEFGAVPEPSTWGLVGFGMLLLIGSARFRKLA